MFQRLREVRLEAGKSVTQRGIAEDYGINQSAVAKWKKGGGARPEHLDAAAIEEGVHVEWLRTGREPKRLPHPDTVEVMNQLDRVDDERRAQILRVCAAMLED